MTETPLQTWIQDRWGRTLVACDANCRKAWGINGRQHLTDDQGRPVQLQLSDDPDDIAYLADHEIGEAPTNTGSWEGGQGKPSGRPERHNKWCVRECERSQQIDTGKPFEIRDFSHRFYNQPWKHEPNHSLPFDPIPEPDADVYVGHPPEVAVAVKSLLPATLGSAREILELQKAIRVEAERIGRATDQDPDLLIALVFRAAEKDW